MASDYENFTSKAFKATPPIRRVSVNTEYAQPQYPSRVYPGQARAPEYQTHPGVKSIVQREIDRRKKIDELREMTEKEKKPFRIPFKWKSASKRASQRRDTVAILFLNIKGEIENPMVVPIHGNMVLIRNKVYEVDPRAFWILKQGMRIYKFLIVKEIDRRPVSNLDLDEIKKRGDSTDSDEFLIKMALRAQQAQQIKSMSKWVIIIIGLAVAAGLIFFFTQS